MNIQLVESLVNAIKSLSLEEQELLGKKLKDHPSWEIALERIDATRKAIYERRQGNPFETDVTEIIHQMREERNRQLIEVRCRRHCVVVRQSGRVRVCGY
ncbi:hypothetical protein [Microcystis aeruginosa]|uniref:Uncharacterized protein n=2 Tax=Microcystis TaxID=1125 RepID=I4HZB0_MICAE|nr:hypothetical protein [Microcystis aeruginosa]REJ43179.1 MAG: hypothetical protein DWQ54_09930 [Microcystis flos-aquae TF09]CCI27384.1 conserved hypothetical protein [Microcystis aeruginosa PCC 9808]